MRIMESLRSLRVYALAGVVTPLMLVIIGLILVGVITYQQVAASLLVEHRKQLAVLSANGISEAVQGYARVLTLLADNENLYANEPQARQQALQQASDVLGIFNAGVMVVDAGGEILGISPNHPVPIRSNIAEQAYFLQLKNQLMPIYSNALIDERDGSDMVIIAVPVINGQGQFNGALLGAIHLQTATLAEPVKRLVINDQAFAYLVDGSGRIIFHPFPDLIGADISSKTYIQAVMRGNSGSMRWTTAEGEDIIDAYAPVGGTGWGLVVQEPWQTLIRPVGTYRRVVMTAGAAALLVMLFLSLRSMRAIVNPIQLLAEQTSQLAEGESITPVAASNIEEFATLEKAFQQMADQVASYRAGLRRYVGAVTQSQEDERRRIARELHDETIQSLLAVVRKLELALASEEDPARRERLSELQKIVNQTLSGVRQISRDLRPLMLEDLGLVPSLRALVSAARQGEGAVPHARFETTGEAVLLSLEQEMALYRIAQEALNNIRKHAKPTGVLVKLEWEQAALTLDVIDDGKGFQVPGSLTELARHGCYGLMGIQERVWIVGGTLRIDSAPGKGTHVQVKLPLQNPDLEERSLTL